VAKASSFQATFEALRKLLKPYERSLTVVKDEPGKYFLASKVSKTRSGSAIWFGGAEIKKNYVTFHLVPVYMNPGLVKDMSPSLRKRMHGKGCLNFTDIDPALVVELATLTKRGFAGFIERYP